MTEIKGNSVEPLKYYAPLLLLPAVNVVQTVLLKEDMVLLGNAKQLLFMFLWVCVEEVVFRKVVPIFLEKCTSINVKKRCLIEAAVFALAHLLNLTRGDMIADVAVQMILAFGVGYVLAALVKRNRNILPCIAVHFLLNATGSTADILSTSVFWNVIWCVLAAGCLSYGYYLLRKE